MRAEHFQRDLSVVGAVLVLAIAILVGACDAHAQDGRERAMQQIPELMGRILETQEEIRERESELAPEMERLDRTLEHSRHSVEQATSEDAAAAALVDYVEAYAERLDAQHAGLASIEGSVARMRADARDLVRASDAAHPERVPPAERESFYGDHYEGLAAATGELAERLEREDEASAAGAVLAASWSSNQALPIDLPQVGPGGARSFARKVEALHARVQARSNQLQSERRSVRRLLDVLIERQLANRLDALFAGESGIGLGAVLAGRGPQGFEDLGALVKRALGLPSSGTARPGSSASLDRLHYFASGEHRR